MTAITITDTIKTREPDREVLVVTVHDGGTLKSQKFTNIRAVNFSFNEDMGALAVVPGFAISSDTLTFHCTGVTGKSGCLEIIGKLGN